ncbi:MAG: hypothetical protein M0Z66_16205 [Thermaerobacter sp.]|nr:hypothetical protein [Thermaerobacter sp.]
MYSRIRGADLERSLRTELRQELDRRVQAVTRQWASAAYDADAEPLTA